MNLNKVKAVWIMLLPFGLIFWIAETWYFGWNRLPQSEAEWWCDYIAALITVIGGVTFHAWNGCRMYKNEKI